MPQVTVTQIPMLFASFVMKNCSCLCVNLIQKTSVYILSVLVLFTLFLRVQTTFLPQKSVYGLPFVQMTCPPVYGARLASLIGRTPQLKSKWRQGLKAMFQDVADRRKSIYDVLVKSGITWGFTHLLSQSGFFGSVLD